MLLVLISFLAGAVVALAGAAAALVWLLSVSGGQAALAADTARGAAAARARNAAWAAADAQAAAAQAAARGDVLVTAAAQAAASVAKGKAAAVVAAPQQQVARAEAVFVGEMKLGLPTDVELQHVARRWCWCVLRANMLIVFESEAAARRAFADEEAQLLRGRPGGSSSSSSSSSSAGAAAPAGKASPPSAIVLLDGATVEPARRGRSKQKVLAPLADPVQVPGKPIWKPKLPLVLSHESRPLWDGAKRVNLYFRQGRDAEAWLSRLRRGAGLRSQHAAAAAAAAGPAAASGANPAQGEAASRAASAAVAAGVEPSVAATHWSEVAANLRHRGKVPVPDFASALLARVFWTLHDDPHFVELVKYKIRRKIEQARDELPSVVHRLDLEEVRFGPRMPIIREAQLTELDADGRIIIDADLDYQGGFFATVLVVLAIPKPVSFIPAALRRSREARRRNSSSREGGKEEVDAKTEAATAALAAAAAEGEADGVDEDGDDDNLYVPIRVSARVDALRGRFRFLANAPPADSFWIGFLEPPDADVHIDYEIGSQEHKITHLGFPQLADLAVTALRRVITEILVVPNMEDIPFPKVSAKKSVADALQKRRAAAARRRSNSQGSTGSVSSTTSPSSPSVAAAAASLAATTTPPTGSGSPVVASSSAPDIAAHVDQLMDVHQRRPPATPEGKKAV